MPVDDVAKVFQFLPAWRRLARIVDPLGLNGHAPLLHVDVKRRLRTDLPGCVVDSLLIHTFLERVTPWGRLSTAATSEESGLLLCPPPRRTNYQKEPRETEWVTWTFVPRCPLFPNLAKLDHLPAGGRANFARFNFYIILLIIIKVN